MQLSGNRNDSIKPLITPTSVSTTSLALSDNDNLPITYGSETDPVFSAWDKSTGVSITRSQVIDDAANSIPSGLVLSSQGINTHLLAEFNLLMLSLYGQLYLLVHLVIIYLDTVHLLHQILLRQLLQVILFVFIRCYLILHIILV